MTLIEHIVYALLWLSFGFLHSMLADQRLKTFLNPIVGNKYRLSYNLIAAIHFSLVFFVGRLWLATNATAFSWSPAWSLTLVGIQFLGLGVIIVALMQYDLGRFSGLAQIKKWSEDADCAASAEPLHTEGLHRWVRHPLYLGLFLLIWTRITNEFALATAIWASIYLFIGTILEEKRLLATYGEEYRIYKSKVPMYIPWKIIGANR